jgi:hypothetical protein
MFTDRPPDLSTEEFATVYAGYPTTDGYAIQLTRADEAAHRAGMVKTTAMLIPFELLSQVSLRRAFELLSELREPDVLTLPQPNGHDAREDAPGSGALADALVGRGALVWTGKGFERALERVWESLATEDKQRLTFGAAVHPDAVSVPSQSGGLIVLRTAERYTQRWNWPHVTVTTPGPSTPAAKAFLNVDHSAQQLAAALFERPPQVEQWRYLAEVSERLARLDELDHEGLRALAQLICLLAAAPAQGQEIKERVAERLHEKTAVASFSDLRGLRAIDWGTLTGGDSVDPILQEWADSVWEDASRGDDLTSAVAEGENSEDEFLERVATQLKVVATSAPEQLPAQAAAALNREEGAVVLRWLAVCFRPRDLDRALAEVVTDSPPPWLAALAREKRLPQTHAASVDLSDAVEAWRAQLALSASRAAIDRLVGRMRAAGTVEAALVLDDERLARRAGELVAADPQLLPHDAPREKVARSIWAAAIRAGADPWAVLEPTHVRDALLEDLVAGVPIEPVLLRALADSQAANIFDHPRRAELWRSLPDDLRESFLSATAPTAASHVGEGGAVPEPELQSAVLSTGVIGPLARKDLHHAVTVLERLSRARAEDALVVMRAARFDRLTAQQFGDLVVKRRWKEVARALVDAESTRPDLREAADRAQALLGLRERIMRAVGLGEPIRAVATRDELRAALLETAAELYPRGPAQRSIWERSGGKESELPDETTGRERWRAALVAASGGARGAPPHSALLDAMVEDYPNNKELAAIAQALKDVASG